MERLTKWLDDKKTLCYGVCEKECVHGYSVCHKCYPFVKAMKKLAEYEDAEEQGRLLVLPCKVWDKLYWISDPDDDEYNYEPIEEVEVCEISYNGYSIHLWFSDKGEKEFPTLPSVAIGNELFLTKAEAEEALEKMKGE